VAAFTLVVVALALALVAASILALSGQGDTTSVTDIGAISTPIDTAAIGTGATFIELTVL
jgi:hypothetical protein